MTFEEIMNLTPANSENFNALVAALRRSTVVPFVGAGMSCPFYPGWNQALDSLKSLVPLSNIAAVNTAMDSVATEIERCDILEKSIGKKRLCRALCNLFDISHFTKHPNQNLKSRPVALLPKLFPRTPLLTTNLERMLEEVYRHYGKEFAAVLSPTDSSILTVLQQQRAHGILYLHGYVSGELTNYEKLIFSKTQYDFHYKLGSPLVQALHDWMNNAQLLFLGCSLRNDRSLDILNRIYTTYDRLEHFAILDLKTEDKDFSTRMIQLEEGYGIRAILYPENQHEAVELILKELLRLCRS